MTDQPTSPPEARTRPTPSLGAGAPAEPPATSRALFATGARAPHRRRSTHPFVWLALAAVALLPLLLRGHAFGPVNWLFGKPYARNMGPGLALVAIAALLPFAVRFVRSRAPLAARLSLLVLTGAGLQLGYALAEGRGLAALADVARGSNAHRDFVDVVTTQDLDRLVPRYEALVKERRWTFPRSKPPGCLMVHQGVVALAKTPLGRWSSEALLPGPPPADAHGKLLARVSGTILVLFPLATFLTVLPLYFLARRLAGGQAAELAVLLFVFVPSVGAVPMYLDGALYPLVVTTAALLVVLGVERRRPELLLAGGVVASVGLFVTFSILPAVALLLGWPTLRALLARDPRGRRLGARLASGALASATFAAGLAAFHALPIAAGYRPLVRYADAMHNHLTWWSGGGHDWRLGSPAQFAVWLGLPVAGAFLIQALRWLRRPAEVGALPVTFALACLGLVAATAMLSHARIEAMRLWLFWVPLVCAAAAPALARWEAELGRRVFTITAIVQVATVFALKEKYSFF